MANTTFRYHPLRSFLQFLPGSLSFLLILLADHFIQSQYIHSRLAVHLNRSFAFGMAILGVVSFLFFVWFIRDWIQIVMDSSKWWLFSTLCGFVLGGALGNILDYNLYGFVIDYWRFLELSWFNLSDIAIILGIFGLFVEFKDARALSRT